MVRCSFLVRVERDLVRDPCIRFSEPWLRRVCFLGFVRPPMVASAWDVNAYFKPSRSRRNSIQVLDEDIVGIAVQPVLTRLSRGDHRMSAGVRMFGRVPVRRAVAAQRDSTCLARPQMHPIAADLHAFFTFGALRLFDRFNRIQMRATPGRS